DERALVLLHEREHLRAHDGRLTTAALIAVVSMPWNPALWYALRRLRTAIEVDCDRRVLRASPDVRRYGGLLVAVAQRAVGSSLAIAGFSERAAPLARRIHAMTISTSRRLSIRDAGVGVLGATALVASILVLPPEAPARSFPGTSTQVQVFAKYVADSIATNAETPVFVGAARDLPVTFSVEQMRPTPGPRSAVDCPMSLRDDRYGTILRVRRSSGGVANVVRRGDTTWTHVRAIGFYAVRPEGRYGVAANQMLRVGCGSSTEIAIAGVPIPSNALSTLDSRDDDRARRIGRAISSLIRVEPIAVDLYTGRLEIVVGDTTAIASTSDAEWDFTYAVFARARDVLGRAAMPETLSVALRRGRSQWMAMYYYKSMAK
ncbi:MAG TPA: M56 family metallopeptidase, partial [Gemmatimonadaceae bacterium]